MKYFITGATGFIGNRVARALLEQGHEIVVLARSPHRARDLSALGADVIRGDVIDRESMREGMTGVDGIFHMAADYTIGIRDPASMEQVNVTGTRNVLKLMRELRIPKGVYTSTVAVFSDTRGAVVDEKYFFEGKHLSHYDRTKWLAHYEVARTMIHDGLPLVIVQPGLVYGPGDTSAIARMFTDFLRHRLPMVPVGTVFCWAHVDDVVDGHLKAMSRGRPGESYILSGPAHSLEEAFELAAKLTRRRPPPIRVGARVLRAMSKAAEKVEYLLPLPSNYSSESLRVAAGTTYISSSEKAKRELDYKPRPLEQGIKGMLTDLAHRLKAGRKKS
jgi:nucleoside-diphosphate-sugar epimerase